MRRAALSLTLLLLIPPGATHAQRLADPVFSSLTVIPRPGPSSATHAMPAAKEASAEVMLVGGVLSGAAGAFAGGIIGAKAADTCEDCALEGLVYGFVAGGSAALPLGVHLANHRRGNYGLSLLASLAIGAAGLGTTLATHDDGRIMIAVPVLQLVSAIAIERATTR